VLGVVIFAATLLLLFGAINLTRRAGPVAAAASPTHGTQSADTATAAPGDGAAPATPSPRAATPSASLETDAVLSGAGDIASCSSGADKKTARLVDAIPGTVFTAGDNAYDNGSEKDFQDCYDPSWGRVKDRTRPAAGNHDWQTNDLEGYLGYFGQAAAPDGKSWYSYDLGAWHIIVLDSDCSKVGGCDTGSDQGRWLAADLKASSALCTLAIWHHPRFSSGIHGNARSTDPFWRALYAAGADVVVNGHEHDYERFAPQDPTGHEDRLRGMREFIVGTGGAPQRPFLSARPNSELRSTGTFGIIRFDLHKASYDWHFIPTSGDFTDSGTAPCH